MRNPLGDNAPDHVVQATITLIVLVVLIAIVVTVMIKPLLGLALIAGLVLFAMLAAAYSILYYMFSK